jgi:hypothetical protein
MHGMLVKVWGDTEDIGIYEPAVVEPIMFVPKNRYLHETRPAMFKVYLEWRKTDWFKRKERDYNYDRHFQPVSFLENHYRKWATSENGRHLKAWNLAS